MRLSSVFQSSSLPSRSPGAEGELTPAVRPGSTLAAGTAGTPQALPEALDERVRLIGEWQLGEPD
jgi:hypothetical protein